MPTVNLAIIGAGPKAAALCAKIACLREAGKVDIVATVFEASVAGANWSGDNGYTDGEQRLCTPPERDLGFPYGEVHGPGVQRAMIAEYSWTAFLTREGGYERWIDDGRRRPPHGLFARYIEDAITRSGAKLIVGRVTRIRRQSSAWTIHYDQDGTPDSLPDFDGVVVTGTGPSLPLLPNAAGVGPVASSRIFNGQSFWSQRQAAFATAEREGEEDGGVVIIGAGGTAAAIAAWFVRKGLKAPIQIIGNQLALYSRVDSAFENRLFSDDDAWHELSVKEKQTFTDRLTRGAVWQSVIEDLAHASNLAYRKGQALDIDLADPLDPGGPLHVGVSNGTPPSRKLVGASIVIDARGFDGWWFRTLLPPTQAQYVDANRDALEERMASDLSLRVPGAPCLHVPNRSRVVHPGYGSLMALGDMADAILHPYISLSGASIVALQHSSN